MIYFYFKKNPKIIILTMRSKDLEMCAKNSSDLYFKAEGVKISVSHSIA